MVYDLGGGTFDVTVMEIRGTDFMALATDGDVRLGGYDWDQRLVDLVAEGFIRSTASIRARTPAAAGKLWRECEDAKRTLSARTKASIPCDYRGFSAQIEVTRQQFEEATQDLLDRTRFTATQTLKAAGLDWGQLDRVLLVGGSTRMPMVRAMLQQVSGKAPDGSVVGRRGGGPRRRAARRPGPGQAQGRPPTFKIKNVNSHSLGVVGIGPADQAETQRHLDSPQHAAAGNRQAELPHAESRPAVDPGADRGRREFFARRLLAVGPLQRASSAPGASPRTPIDVLFHYRTDGRLKVKVSIPNTEAKVEAEFARENSLSKDLLDGWRRYISGAEPTDYA